MKRQKNHNTPAVLDRQLSSVPEGITSDDHNQPPVIEIGIYRKGEEEPYEIELPQVPKGFPDEFRSTLAEFFCDGFRMGVVLTEHPKLRIKRLKGRRPNPVIKDLGKQCAILYKEKHLSFGQIAPKLCEKKNELGHKCSKACADRLYRRAEPFLKLREK